MISIYLIIGSLFLASNVIARQNHQHGRKYSPYPDYDNDLSLWIDEAQVKIFSGKCASKLSKQFISQIWNKNHWYHLGFSMKIFAIDNGRVSMHLKSPNFNNNLPIIPSEVSCVNFTWRSGTKRYYYHFDRLQSLDENILKPPTVSIKIKGKVPQDAKGLWYNHFNDWIWCANNMNYRI